MTNQPRKRSTVAKRWLSALTEQDSEIGLHGKLTQEDLGTIALIKKMRAGDVRAYSVLMDSAYGPPVKKKPVVKKEKPAASPFAGFLN